MSLDVLKSVRGGGRGIRTPVTLSGKAVFKTACFNHSHIPPQVASIYFSSLYDDLRFRFTRRGLHINACRDSITVKLCGSTPSRTLLHRFRQALGMAGSRCSSTLLEKLQSSPPGLGMAGSRCSSTLKEASCSIAAMLGMAGSRCSSTLHARLSVA